MTFDFPSNTANPTFFRTYSRLKEDFKTKESVTDVFERGLSGLFKLGDYTTEEQELIRKNLYSLHTLFSGRWLWVGGKEFLEKPKNFYASYNCIGMSTEGLQDFGRCFNLLMQGCGVGASITEPELANLPPIISGITLLDITDQEGIGSRTTGVQDHTYISDNIMYVGDSREAWVDAILNILSMATTEGEWQIFIDLKSPRKAGTPIKGFGGVANPTDLRQLFIDIIEMLNSYVGREWDSFLAAWLYGRVAKCTVAGNVRRSAELMQGSENDATFTDMKTGMWQQTPEGKWIIDPKKDPLRMANHSRMFFHKPSYQDLEDAVRKQYYSGEGAIAYTPMAIIRCNVDLLDTDGKQNYFHALYLCDTKKALDYLSELAVLKGLELTPEECHHRIERWRANPCVEVLGKDFLCNLAEVHLNQLDPLNLQQQKEAFQSGGLITASLLAHVFDDEKFRYSREIDPIVGVSITGLFDFFVNLFGVDWLKWWQAGRPEEWIPENNQQLQNVWFVTDCYPEEPRGNIYRRIEQKYLSFWRDTAMKAVWDYCDRNGLRRPNRVTVVQPAGTKSLLTGASCGYHPPKASRYIRRITFAKNDPIALACIDYGYTVVPSQSDKNENGELLDNPFDPRCTEWLVEIPVEVAWASIADEAQLDPNHFSAAAQFDFFMQVQTYYTQHNTSSTIELREHEISELAKAIYTAIQTNQPYFSTALLSRFDSFESFPRLPFEPVSKEKYEELVASVLARRKSEDFYALMSQYQKGVEFEDDRGSVACESEVCSINKR
ncbi:MAG: ribonucleoside-triphosphate reductase, adenosylcobalamin-dependent [Cytophagales bacterium]|nr:ribonucleoside-triphosphate reductase, adenosylcobalamin-dependent [Cytophagales bacterium]